MNFENLGLSPPILSAIKKAGYERPTPIQAQAIPVALAGRDVLGCAQTGTGKTAAFSLPILEHMRRRSAQQGLKALILTPTRELAAQIGDCLKTYGSGSGIRSSVIFGGVSEQSQIKELSRGVDVLVATPGRLLDLLSRGFASLDRVEVFVLDEADRMLDMGFLNDVKKIVQKLPRDRQTLLFSATMPSEIQALADRLLRNPEHISVTPVSSSAERIEQRIYPIARADKRRLLVDLLKLPQVERTLVFSRTKHGANRISEELLKAGISSAAIHGNKSQGARTRALLGFKMGSVKALVATDIAARGIDVDGVTHVINFDIPNVPETYVHRIGRTARAGRDGTAFSLCDSEERAYVRDIERLIGRSIERVLDHPYRKEDAPTEAGSAQDRPAERNHARGPHGRAPDRRVSPSPRRDGAGRHPSADNAREAHARREHSRDGSARGASAGSRAATGRRGS